MLGIVATANATPDMQRNARGRARRLELMTAGVRLVRRNGLRAVRMNDITREVGVSPALFSWYFASVDELLLSATQEAIATLRSALTEAVIGIDEPLARVELRLRAALQLLDTDEIVEFLMRADALGWALRDDLAHAVSAGDDLLFLLVNDIAEAQACGVARVDVPPFLLASCVRSVFADTRARHFRGQTRVPLGKAMDAAIKFAVHGVTPPSSEHLAAGMAS